MSYGWVGVYILSPVVVIALWWRDRRTVSGRPAPGDPIVPDRVLLAARLVGIGALAGAGVFLTSPQTMIDRWAWQLTPLTARVIGCFTAQVAVGALWLSLDARWSAWRLIVQTFFVATALLLVGAVRAWDDFDTGRPMTWMYLGGLLAGDVALALLYRSMSRRNTSPRSLRPPADPVRAGGPGLRPAQRHDRSPLRGPMVIGCA